ncbi:hypothetical protein F4810DRAFT_406730 [Camillea tinctor]|nr:hypothetical protein F4810DRAFT_406730 [Camillea tinctor]
MVGERILGNGCRIFLKGFFFFFLPFFFSKRNTRLSVLLLMFMLTDTLPKKYPLPIFVSSASLVMRSVCLVLSLTPSSPTSLHLLPGSLCCVVRGNPWGENSSVHTHTPQHHYTYFLHAWLLAFLFFFGSFMSCYLVPNPPMTPRTPRFMKYGWMMVLGLL